MSGPATAILVHSSGLSSRQWRRWLPTLGTTPRGERPLVPLDLLGCGANPRWAGPWPFELRRDLDLVLSALDGAPGPSHLVGHSYGGSLALFAALERPERVRSVAVFEPPLFGVLRSVGELDGPLDVAPGAPPGSEAWLRAFVEWWNGPGAYDLLAAPVREELLATAPKVAGEVADLARDDRPLDAYGRLGLPLLLLGGTRSPAAIARGLDLLGTLPGAVREVIPGAPHMAPLLDPDPLARRVAAFLAAHDP